MGIFDWLLGGSKPAGYIRYYGLADWWCSAFTPQERSQIEATVKEAGTYGLQGCPLTQGEVGATDESVVAFLTSLASWFQRSENRSIARRIIAKAEDSVSAGCSVLDLHFLYQAKIKTFYADRNQNPDALNTAIRACEQQIGLSPQAAKAFRKEYRGSPLPAHAGYEQLAIIREKAANYSEALRLSRQAKSKKWAGDWEGRIARLQKKLRTR